MRSASSDGFEIDVRSAASGAAEIGAEPDPGGADLGAPTTVVLVRHGRTEDTEQRRARGGDIDGPALTAAGERDAERLARWLLDRWPPDRRGCDPRFEAAPVALITSPVARAQQTAATLGAALTLVPEPDGGWAELSLGDWDGLGYAEMAAGWPQLYRQWQASPEVAPPGGESLVEVGRRVALARDRLLTRYPGRTVLVVSHTAPIRIVLAQALDAGPAALWRLRVDPTSVSVVRFWADGGCEVAAVNSVARQSWDRTVEEPQELVEELW